MKLTYERVVELKYALVKAQRFEMASWFREEEKRLLAAMPKKRQQEIANKKEAAKATEGKDWMRVQIKLPAVQFAQLSHALNKAIKAAEEINWKQTGKDPHDLYAKPKRGHMLRVERLEKGVYWWAFYIGKDSFASYDVGDYGKSLEDAKEKCELYYYLKITA